MIERFDSVEVQSHPNATFSEKPGQFVLFVPKGVGTSCQKWAEAMAIENQGCKNDRQNLDFAWTPSAEGDKLLSPFNGLLKAI